MNGAAAQGHGGLPDCRLALGVHLVAAPDGGARLVDLDGAFYGLTAVAADMLRGMLAGPSADAAAAVAVDYGVPLDVVSADLAAFRADLARRGLVETGSGRIRRRMRRILARVALAPFLAAQDICGPSATGLLILARLAVRIFGFGAAASAFRPGTGGAPTRSPDLATVAAIDREVIAAAARLPGAACKEIALAAWRLLAARGLPAELVVGIEFYPLAGHCWCRVGDRICADLGARAAGYTIVASSDW
ncbi:lasso peptide biosynthesis B2 protein [Prosthecomicrobium sp. N25]|uniref:lasso peptide biosynthesis B2 protein n=1 Tax=Prosthecomicrobium sp. N25 TaxID=3129254 RepID=UPI0030786113